MAPGGGELPVPRWALALLLLGGGVALALLLAQPDVGGGLRSGLGGGPRAEGAAWVWEEELGARRPFSGANTGLEAYPWSNAQGAARVVWSGASDGTGAAWVELRDARGELVLRQALPDSGVQSRSGAGAPGAWTVTLDFVDWAGRMALRVEPAVPEGAAGSTRRPSPS